jgi:hypothetical protein
MNLVGNALEFTQRGEMVVRVSARPWSEAGALLRVSVDDTGSGIAPATLAKPHQAAGSGAGFEVVLIDEPMPVSNGTQPAERITKGAELTGTRLVLVMAVDAPASAAVTRWASAGGPSGAPCASSGGTDDRA